MLVCIFTDTKLGFGVRVCVLIDYFSCVLIVNVLCTVLFVDLWYFYKFLWFIFLSFAWLNDNCEVLIFIVIKIFSINAKFEFITMYNFYMYFSMYAPLIYREIISYLYISELVLHNTKFLWLFILLLHTFIMYIWKKKEFCNSF